VAQEAERARVRALVIHNFYRSENASGENLSVRDEVTGLRDLGWDVEVLSADSDLINPAQLSLARVATRPIHSVAGVRRVNEAIGRFRPHVALVENLFPMHSPSAIRALRKAGVPVAAGVRSYRMWCAASTMYRDGAPCRDCVGSVANLPAVLHGCYQGSSARTLPMAVSLTVHRPTFREIDAFLAVSEHVRDELVAARFPAARVIVRPNFVPDPGPSTDDVIGSGFLFAGRLSEEKGVRLLLDAWERSGVWRTDTLTLAGSGDLLDLVRAQRAELRVEALGLLDHDTLMQRLGSAAVMVVPSVWPEPFGRGVIEAAAAGRPSLVTRVGGLPSLVVDGSTGWVADPDPDDLAAGFRRAADATARQLAGVAARRRFLKHYTREVSMGILDVTLRRLAIRGRDLV
jgi:glycosyltransferase involved in cell wall biosynthesis